MKSEHDAGEAEEHFADEHSCRCPHTETRAHQVGGYVQPSESADEHSACCLHEASSGENDGHEQDDYNDGVVHRVVHRAALDSTLEVLVGEPETSDAQRQGSSRRDEDDEVNEAELDASLRAVGPPTSTFTEVVLFASRQRGQGEQKYRKEQHRVVLPLETGEYDVSLSATVAPPEQEREHPQNGVLVHERNVVVEE